MSPSGVTPTTRTADTAGRLLAGRYRLQDPIGRGGMATVYRAIDTTLERPVAIMLLSPRVAADVSLRARFRRHAATAARLVHPHIAAVLDAGFARFGDGSERPFVVTEPAGGQSLRELLGRRGKLGPARALRLTHQLASAMAHAHRQGVIHADVRPENVMVDPDGSRAKLVAFSVSFVSAHTGAITQDTIARRSAYPAPEQVRGEPVSAATDVYGLGVLLYELLFGRPPFVADRPEQTAERRVHEAARPVGLYDPYLPAEIEHLLSRAFDRRPERRWRSIEEFDRALAAVDLSAVRPPPERELPGAVSSAARPLGMAPGHPGLLASILPLAAIGLAIILVATYLMPALRNAPRLSNLFSDGTTVPNVVGLDAETARHAAEGRGLEFIVVGERVSDKTPRGEVVLQAPIPGWTASDQPLRVTLSAGVEVPDVRGRSQENATRSLSELGWRVAQVERTPFPGHASGTVVLQHPPPGEVAPNPGEMLLAVAE